MCFERFLRIIGVLSFHHKSAVGLILIQVGIVGGTGYTGVELLRLLAMHPKAQVKVITSRSEAGRKVADLFPSLRGFYALSFSEPNTQSLLACDVIFFATPHGVAQGMMAELISAEAKVIDLSADFRIRDIDTWERWYGQTHGCPDLVSQAVYGLPEVNREKIKSARLVACPGCYPTSVQLGLKPLLEKGWIDTTNIIANSASGISGAGRQAKIDSLLAENADSFKAYAVAGHRHKPEIEQGLQDIIGEQSVKGEGFGKSTGLNVTFVPHLLPMIRGIHSTIYVQLKDTIGDIQALFEQNYKDEVFVDVLPRGFYPQTRSVKGTNMCRISIEVPGDGNIAVIMSVIDNLNKGAAGQAIQNLNIMFGFDESCGLMSPPLSP